MLDLQPGVTVGPLPKVVEVLDITEDVVVDVEAVVGVAEGAIITIHIRPLALVRTEKLIPFHFLFGMHIVRKKYGTS